jgi:hypothetical protein
MKRTKFVSFLLASVLAGAGSAALAQNEPLDLKQSYSGNSDVGVSHILTYNTYANGAGATNSFAFGPGDFYFEDPFLKSSANPPLLTYFLGVSTDDTSADHLILALNSGYAAGLVSGGQDFSQIFPTYNESSLINDLVLIDTQQDAGSPGAAAQDAARNEIGNFSYDLVNRNALTPAFGGPFTLLSFSAPTAVGSGVSTVQDVPLSTPVPEPGAFGMMIAGLTFVAWALYRRNHAAGALRAAI